MYLRYFDPKADLQCAFTNPNRLRPSRRLFQLPNLLPDVGAACSVKI